MHGGSQAVVQFRQGGVGLFTDQHDQPVAAVWGHLDGAAGVGLGGKRPAGAAALEQAADPGGADAEAFGDLAAGAAPFVAGADDPLAEVL
jgi:hypothetical protein